MTTDQVLQKIRRFINQVDQSTSDLTDEELLAVASDERDDLELEGMRDYVDLAVGYDQTDETTYGILPEASLTTELGTILAYRVAASILRETYRQRVDRGEIGTSWVSGLESESTLQAGREYQNMIDNLTKQAEALILIKRAPTNGTRPQ